MEKSTHQLEIHSQNILPIIKKWLYSERDIFARELISNACDAVKKLEVLQPEGNDNLRVEVKINKEDKTLQFIDNGIGMTEDEVVKYIAQIAFSGAEAFMEQYEGASKDSQFIGHFGLGFYSSYMVSEKVTIDTLSYKEGTEAVRWECDGSASYTLDKSQRSERGTTITLHLNEESLEYLEEGKIEGILKQYGRFLPYSVFVDEKLINPKPPLWLKKPSDCTKEEYLDFFKELYPYEQTPHFWIHLNVDYPLNMKGILYFPKFSRSMDLNESQVQLYCNRVFVSNDCKSLLPSYLLMLKGAIDCPDLPLNVSRSYLQSDKTVRQLSQHIAKKVADNLKSLYKDQKDDFLKAWRDLEIILKVGAMQDDKFFKKVQDILVWETVEGEWLTLKDLAPESEEEKIDLYYAPAGQVSSQIAKMYKEHNLHILNAHPHIDISFFSYLEGQLKNVQFKRVDGAVLDQHVDKSREKTILDADGRTEASYMNDFFSKQIDAKDLTIEIKSLTNDSLPALIVLDENERRMRDYFRRMQPDMANSPIGPKETLVLNSNNALVQSAYKLRSEKPETAKLLAQHLYDLALVSQHEVDHEKMDQFIQNHQTLLESLLPQ